MRFTASFEDKEIGFTGLMVDYLGEGVVDVSLSQYENDKFIHELGGRLRLSHLVAMGKWAEMVQTSTTMPILGEDCDDCS